MELKVVRSKQMHSCGVGCLRPHKNGKMKCKRRAPWPLSEEVEVKENGQWKPRRQLGKMNNFNPTISVNLQCNNDIKLLTNAGDTEGLSHYIASYQTKKQGKSYNVSALLSKALLYHETHSAYVTQLQEKQRLFLFRCMHTLNMQQEISQAMVNLYLLGHSEAICSHRYCPIYWNAFHWSLVGVHPQLLRRAGEQDAEDEHDGQRMPAEDDEQVSLGLEDNGKLYRDSQVSKMFGEMK